jgi:hypothetical protein
MKIKISLSTTTGGELDTQIIETAEDIQSEAISDALKAWGLVVGDILKIEMIEETEDEKDQTDATGSR